jgi:ribosome biogenesis GTPase A
MNKDLPGHIRKAFRSVDRYLPVVDVIVELVDSRMPNGSRLKNFVGKLGKISVIALSKSDLADKDTTKLWIERYKREGFSCVALDCRDRNSVKNLAKIIKSSVVKVNDGKNAPLRKVRRVMIIGIPNVGKSTLINSLAGRSAARAANMPGVTRSVQWIKISGELELLDLPGILDFSLLRRGDLLKLINTIPGRDDDTYTKAKNLCRILYLTENERIIPDYGLYDQNFDKFISEYARKMNFIIKGGNPDLQRATNDIIKRFQSGGLGRVTLEHPEKDFSGIIAQYEQQSLENTEESQYV